MNSFFYNTIIEFLEKGIKEKKYFYNTEIFESKDEIGFFNESMSEYIIKGMTKIVSTLEGQKLYHHLMSSLYNDISRVYITKEVVRTATLEYYKDEFREGKIDIDMDIRNLNISHNTIKSLKEKLSISNNIITLKDIMTITNQDLSNWHYNGGSNKNEIIDLQEFCNDIYSIVTKNITDNDQESELIESKQILQNIQVLEKEYITTKKKRLKLEKKEQNILDEIQQLKTELLEQNFNNTSKIRTRK